MGLKGVPPLTKNDWLITHPISLRQSRRQALIDYFFVFQIPSIYLPVCLSIYLSTYLSTYLPTYLSIYPSIHLSIDPSIHRSIDPSIYRSIDLPYSILSYAILFYLSIPPILSVLHVLSVLSIVSILSILSILSYPILSYPISTSISFRFLYQNLY